MPARVSMLLKSRAFLTCFRACFLPGRAKDLSAPRYLLRLNLKTKGEHHLEFKISSLQEICALLGYYAANSGNFLPIGPIDCPETSRNYHYSLRNSPEERIFQLLREGSLKSRKVTYSFRRTSHDSIRRHLDFGSFRTWLNTISLFRSFDVSEDAAEEPQIPTNILVRWNSLSMPQKRTENRGSRNPQGGALCRQVPPFPLRQPLRRCFLTSTEQKVIFFYWTNRMHIQHTQQYSHLSPPPSPNWHISALLCQIRGVLTPNFWNYLKF